MSNIKNMKSNDIDISGMIVAERKAAPTILTPVKEALHNSLEVLRLARQFDSRNKGMIELIFHMRGRHLEKWSMFDQATKNTGIKNLESKQLYKLYKHEGVQTGFSEYGIGSKLENLRCCDLIEHHTITDSGIYERTSWHIPRSIESNSLLDVIEYNANPNYQPMRELFNHELGFNTGTLLECSSILPRLKNLDTANYIMDPAGLLEDINHSLVQFDSENIQIFFKVFENGDLKMHEQIGSKDYLYGYRETYDLISCEDKTTREISTFIKLTPVNETMGFESILSNQLSNSTIQNNDKFVTYYGGQKIDNLGSDKPKEELTGARLKQTFSVKSHVKLICTTAEYEEVDEDNSKYGFYGFREVEGGNIVCTTPEPLLLKWGKLKSHKTRHCQLRVGIQYDRQSDQVLLSDKSKTLSDDREIDASLRINILKLTDMYISKMRKEHKFYETDLSKRPQPPIPVPNPLQVIEFQIESSDSESDSESELQQEQQQQQTESSNSKSESESELQQEQQQQQQTESSDSESDSELQKQQQETTDSDDDEEEESEEEEPVPPVPYTTSEQKRMHVPANVAISHLKKIYTNYQQNNLVAETKDLLIKIACNLIGKGGDETAEIFIRYVPMDKLYENIKIIWQQESEQVGNVKMGTEVVNFVACYCL
jgi:hypothetical protein